MASRGYMEPSPALSESVEASFRDGEEEERMEKLRKIQLAHEGMRLLLCSQVKQAEELFRTSRYRAYYKLKADIYYSVYTHGNFARHTMNMTDSCKGYCTRVCVLRTEPSNGR